MADFDYDRFGDRYGGQHSGQYAGQQAGQLGDQYGHGYPEAPEAQPGLALQARRWVNIAGAVCSVSLVLGLALWGYRLAVRDVAGVPVMRAMAGPMRIAPEDPGGEQALNQGLTVNAIAAMGTSAPAADQVTLAPAATALQPGDVPQTTPAATAAPTAAPTAPDPTVMADAQAAAPAPADAAPAPIVVPSDPNAIRVSLRPQPRPSAIKLTNVQATSGSTQARARELDPAAIPDGTRLAQLGPFDSPDLARSRFAELQGTFGDLMAGKAMVIEAAQSGGRSFYRLRAAGFDNDADVRRFCAALQAEDTDCVPVTQRKS